VIENGGLVTNDHDSQVIGLLLHKKSNFNTEQTSVNVPYSVRY